MLLSLIYQTRASTFGQQNIHNGKKISVRDLCDSEASYLTSKRDDSYVRYLEWLSEIFGSGLNRPKIEN